MGFYIPAAVATAWIVAHIIKEIVYVYNNKKFSWYTLLFETGGMPSSHSSSVTALATAVLLQEGMTVIFWVALMFTIVVVRDAYGVRRSVSDQAEFINQLLSKAKFDKKVKVVLGHTPLQVTVGVVLGILTSIVLYLVW